MMQGHIFAGQGAQHPGMANALLENSPVALDLFKRANDVLGWDLLSLCTSGSMEELTACATCQPAIFAVSVISFLINERKNSDSASGIFGGLSLGEWSALCCAGAVSFEDGLKIVAKRGQLMDVCCKKTSGAMCAIIGAETEFVEKTCLENDIEIANFNCPGQLIISGEAKAVSHASELLLPNALKVVPLTVAGAYHSKLMKDAGDSFREFLSNVKMELPRFPLVHNLTGKLAGTSVDEIKDIMALQIYSSVRWEQCSRTMMEHCGSFHEYGPGKTLAGLIHRIDRKFPVESDNF